MTTSNLNLFYYAKITLKEKANPTNTKVVNLSNRPLPDEAATTTYYPILLRCNGMGSSAGETTPDSRSGGIEIDNSNGSFGYERRFSDLFDIYAIIGATIEVYSANVDLADINRDADFSLEWKSEIVGASDRVDTLPQTLRLNVAEEGIPRRVVTRLIESAGFPTAPEKSLGQHLPLVFSQTGTPVPVKAYQIVADGTLDPSFAYATTFGDDYVVGGVSTLLVKNVTGTFESVNNPVSTVTAVVDKSTGTEWELTIRGVELANYFTLSNRVIVQGEMKFSPWNDPAWVAGVGTKVSIKIYERYLPGTSGASNIGPLVAEGSFLKSQYQTEMRGSTAFWAGFSLSKPLVTRSPGGNCIGYFISVSQSSDPTAGTGGPYGDVFAPIVAGDISDQCWAKGEGGAFFSPSETVWVEYTSNVFQRMFYKLYGAYMTDFPNCVSSTLVNSDGLGYAYFQMSQKSAASGQHYCDLTELEIIASVNGLKDDPGGSLTGTANLPLAAPHHAMKVLEKSWDGTSWTGTLFDWTRFANNHSALFGLGNFQKAYWRELGGATQGRTTLDQVMSDICRNSACKVVRTRGSSNQLALWAWGYSQAISTVITDEDSKILAIDYAGYETVINRTLLRFSYTPVNTNVVGLVEQGQRSNFTRGIDFSSSTSDYIRYFSNDSTTIFRRREIQNGDLEFVRAFASSSDYTHPAESIALYYLAAFRGPSVYATIEVPFFKYRTLDLMDVIEIKHPGLPNYYGSSSAARLPYYSGSAVDVLDGQYYKRCNRYRAIIEGMETNFSGTQYPVKRLVLRLLTNFPHDPT